MKVGFIFTYVFFVSVRNSFLIIMISFVFNIKVEFKKLAFKLFCKTLSLTIC